MQTSRVYMCCGFLLLMSAVGCTARSGTMATGATGSQSPGASTPSPSPGSSSGSNQGAAGSTAAGTTTGSSGSAGNGSGNSSMPAASSGAASRAEPQASSGAGAINAPAPMGDDVTCYELAVHGTSSATDTSPFEIPTGESYHCFYFDAPWNEPVLSVAVRSKLDNARSLHHWFLYAMPSATPSGTVETCLPLHLDGPRMLAGWAPGAKDLTLPDDVGAETPAPGSTLMLEWHYLNSTSAALSDMSKVSVCTVPMGKRTHVASVTTVGTENLGVPGMPPGMESTFSGTCTPSRMGLGSGDPIHVLYVMPHMHQYGRHLAVSVQHAGGMSEPIYDQPFTDTNQNWSAAPGQLSMGDNLQTTCTFQNTSTNYVGYGGPFADGEMCYAFVLHYPAHSLDNGARSLLGASNSCL
jgi:hypothetical protein